MSPTRWPCLYWFNPTCDLTAGRASFTPTSALRDLASDLAMVPALLAAPNDVVIVPQRPSVMFRQSLAAAGLPVPELIEWDVGLEEPPASLQRQLSGLRPWGWSPDSVSALEPLADRLPEGTAGPAALWSEARRQLYSKKWSVQWLGDVIDDLRAPTGDDWLCDRAVVGSAFTSGAEVMRALERGFAAGWNRAVVKAAFGAAGGQRMIISGGNARAHQERWLVRALQEAGAVVVEPWLDRVLDLSAQYEVTESGSVQFLGMTRFLADERGRFQGVFVHDMAAGLAPEIRRFLGSEGRDGGRLQRLFSLLGDLLAARLPEGYQGAIGIDTLVYRDATGAIRLKPIVEVNPRFTMGRIGLSLGRHVLSNRTAMWRIVRVADMIDAGYADAETWARDLRKRLPLEMTADGRQISRGVVFTNEPASARSFVGVLAVGDGLAELGPLLANSAG
jgi:hypothetical protein